MMHTGGVSRFERRQWRVVIFSNLVNTFKIMLAKMDELGSEFEDMENRVRRPSHENQPGENLKLT